jgi:hypothetical protein
MADHLGSAYAAGFISVLVLVLGRPGSVLVSTAPGT